MLHPTHTQKKKLKGLIKIKKEEAFETKHVSPTSQTKTLFLQCWASLILSSPSHCIEEVQQRKRIRETSWERIQQRHKFYSAETKKATVGVSEREIPLRMCVGIAMEEVGSLNLCLVFGVFHYEDTRLWFGWAPRLTQRNSGPVVRVWNGRWSFENRVSDIMNLVRQAKDGNVVK